MKVSGARPSSVARYPEKPRETAAVDSVYSSTMLQAQILHRTKAGLGAA